MQSVVNDVYVSAVGELLELDKLELQGANEFELDEVRERREDIQLTLPEYNEIYCVYCILQALKQKAIKNPDKDKVEYRSATLNTIITSTTIKVIESLVEQFYKHPKDVVTVTVEDYNNMPSEQQSMVMNFAESIRRIGAQG